jgi:bacterioferritin-associated ferredoxin
VYVCNCNGIRERDVRRAVEEGASRPREVFRRCHGRPQCAKCVCDMRRMIETHSQGLRFAAE